MLVEYKTVYAVAPDGQTLQLLTKSSSGLDRFAGIDQAKRFAKNEVQR